MKKYILAFVLIFTSSISYAAENSSRMNIDNIVGKESGSHYLYFSENVPDQGCSVQSSKARLDESLAGGKAMFSVAFAALMANKQIVIRVDGCLGDSPKIVKVQIYQ